MNLMLNFLVFSPVHSRKLCTAPCIFIFHKPTRVFSFVLSCLHSSVCLWPLRYRFTNVFLSLSLTKCPSGASASAPAAANPFQVSQPAPPTLNQMRVSPMPSGFAAMPEPMSMSSLPTQPVTLVPMPGMAPMGRVMPGMGVGAVGGVGISAGIPSSMSMPQPLMSMPTQAGVQPAGTTNPFLLWESDKGGGGHLAPQLTPLSSPLLLWLRKRLPDKRYLYPIYPFYNLLSQIIAANLS